MSVATTVENAAAAEVVQANPPASAITLSAVGGCVDGLGYVLLGLFTAHITGNTVKTGADIAHLHLSQAAVDFFPIAVFVAGGFGGALLRQSLVRRMPQPRIAVLCLSAALLVAFVGAGELLTGGRAPSPGGAPFYVLAALATLSMGVQNAAKPIFAGRPVRTFMTGTMTDFAETMAASATSAAGGRRARLRHAGLLLLVWLAYLLGGTVAGATALRYGTVAAAIPAGGVLTALALELRAR